MVGTAGAVGRGGKGVSMPDMSVEERLACDDSSSSDSEPGPGDITAAGGGGGTGRVSADGSRGGAPLLGGGGTGRDSMTQLARTPRSLYECIFIISLLAVTARDLLSTR